MRIIEINALPNGAHRNQVGAFSVIPDGWAAIQDTLDTPNFPFGEAIAEDVSGVMTVTSWSPLPIPEPEPDPTKSDAERISALQAENRLLTQQVTALSDQNDFQEELIVELANIVYA